MLTFFWGVLLLLPLAFNPATGETETVKWSLFTIFTLIIALCPWISLRFGSRALTVLISALMVLGAASTLLAPDIDPAFWGSDLRVFGFSIFISGIILAGALPTLFFKIESVHRLQFALSWSGFVCALMALILGLFNNSTLFEARLGGTFGNPNYLGQFLLVTTFLSAVLLFRRPSFDSLLIFLPQALVLVFTGNRASWIALFLSFFLYLYFSFEKKDKKLILPGLGLGAVFVGILLQRFSELQSLQTRWELYKTAASALFKHPILGYGLEQQEVALTAFNQRSLASADRVHQLFLDTALTMGLPAAVVFYILLALVFGILFKNHRGFAFAFLALVLSLQSSFMGVTDAFLLFLFVGLANVFVTKKARFFKRAF